VNPEQIRYKLDLCKKAKQAPLAPVQNQNFPSPRRSCLKRLSGLRLPQFEISTGIPSSREAKNS